ncbi:GPI-anchor transamidase, partial [Capsaspora owczarzaki ATCC 30864]|uniref:GPI-anchor transamidase n=1 Tax=Capsaspora owczarzaki (strain ATCC 30864) TaxID=595528 RepID=A0A0D2UP18_CAPO3
MQIATVVRQQIVALLLLALFSAVAAASMHESSSSSLDSHHDRAAAFLNERAAAGHTNNWAVLVATSKYWFNYRHTANTLAMYRSVKRLGIPDSNIILMLADDMACNTRNPFPGTVFHNTKREINVYGENIEVDYRGSEVTVENFLRVLTGRFPEHVPRSKRLLSDDRSNILVYMTGHGGDEFLKFQDSEEISSRDIADAFEQMWQKRRYNEIMFVIDTCQANTMYSTFYSPHILACGSAALGETSYSHHADPVLGVAVVDRFTYHALEFLESVRPDSSATIADFFKVFDWSALSSTFGYRDDLFGRDIKQVRLTEFFGNVQPIELLEPRVVEDSEARAQLVQRVLNAYRTEEPEVSKVAPLVSDSSTDSSSWQSKFTLIPPTPFVHNKAYWSVIGTIAVLTATLVVLESLKR